MSMRRWIGDLALGCVLGCASLSVGNAQFGGLINKAKEKIDKANREVDKNTDKAKPVATRVERAADTFVSWSPQEEEEIGAAAAAKMIAMFGTYDEPRLVRYLNLVGSAIAQFAPRQAAYRFAILDTDIVGAFALPGGYIFITKAAVEGMNNEAELAGALGHEIIHVSERHLESEIRSKKTSAWAVQEGRAASTVPAAEALRRRADALLSDMFTMRLSRDKEEGADVRGTQLAAQAGYASNGLLNFLRTLETAQSQPGTARNFGQLLSTHPPFQERIATLEPIVQKAASAGRTLEPRFRGALP
jgi:predicted Zn-dependent protease